MQDDLEGIMKQNLFRRFLCGSWHKIIGLSLLGSAASVCGVFLALVSKQVVDVATGQAEGELLFCGMLLGGFILAQLILQIFLTVLHVQTVTSLRFRLQSKMFQGYLQKQKLAADRFHSGELVNRISGDTAIVAEGMANLIPTVVSVMTQIIFSFCALLMLDSVLAVLCVLAGVFMLAGAQLYRKKTGVLFRESRECEGKMRSFIQETAQNLAVIKAFSVYSVVRRQLGRTQDEAYRLALRKNRANIGIQVCFYTVMTAGYYLALGYGAWQMSQNGMTFGTLTAILGLTGTMAEPFHKLVSLFPQYISVGASAERLEELEQLPEEEVLDPVDPQELYRDLREISLMDVGFSYGDGAVLQEVSAVFPKDTLTAVTGESGAGKSTLLNLLAGILKPDFGDIILDTESGRLQLDSSHRRLFAYVPQEFLLLSGNVLENITLFEETPDMERFWKAVQMAELEKVIAKLPAGIYTQLGEGGGRLSGGQRQRMALARALYSQAGVLLLDEATSALSKEKEEAILQHLRSSGRTVIFVTHRHTAAGLCDRVLKTENGRLYETE